MATIYCNPGLLDHNVLECGYKLGGISALLIGQRGTVLADPSDEVEVQNLIDAGLAKLVDQIRGEIAAGSPILIDSLVGCGTQDRINEDRTFTWVDGNVTEENSAFYNDINKKRVGFILAYLCDNNEVIYMTSSTGIVISAQLIVPPQNNDAIRYENTGSWRNSNMPSIHVAPAGIFS